MREISTKVSAAEVPTALLDKWCFGAGTAILLGKVKSKQSLCKPVLSIVECENTMVGIQNVTPNLPAINF